MVGVAYSIDLKKFTKEYKAELRRYIDLKARCASIAESLNDTLNSFLVEYYEGEKESKEINALSFSELRDLLSDILKNDDSFYSVNWLGTAKSRKTYRKIFNDFIADRNMYTHGNIKIKLNDGVTYIWYKEKNIDGVARCIINDESIQAFFNTYRYLVDVLRDMRKVLHS